MLLAALALTGAAAGLAVTTAQMGDYDSPTLRTGDDPLPAMRDLLDGRWGAAAHEQPMMGASSLVLRLPAVWLARALGAGPLTGYRLGCLLCLLVVALTLLGAAAMSSSRGRSPGTALGLAMVGLVNPVTLSALSWGHPEDLLGGALAVAAVLLAATERPALAGLALGCALGTKPWGLLAIVPVMLVPGVDRRRVGLATVATLPLTLALPLLDPHAFLRDAHIVGDIRTVTPTSWIWLIVPPHEVSAHSGVVTTSVSVHSLPTWLPRSALSWIAPAAAIPLARRWRRHARDLEAVDALALLALSMLLRAALDPVGMFYYWAPAVLALVAWETVRGSGAPVVSLGALAGLWLAFGRLAVHPVAAALVFALISGGLAVWLLRAVARGQVRAPAAVLLS